MKHVDRRWKNEWSESIRARALSHKLTKGRKDRREKNKNMQVCTYLLKKNWKCHSKWNSWTSLHWMSPSMRLQRRKRRRRTRLPVSGKTLLGDSARFHGKPKRRQAHENAPVSPAQFANNYTKIQSRRKKKRNEGRKKRKIKCVKPKARRNLGVCQNVAAAFSNVSARLSL